MCVGSTVYLKLRWSAHLTINLDQAGSDTTHAGILRFLLAMILHPKVQRKGQEELDRVVGADRLPCLEEWVLCPLERTFSDAGAARAAYHISSVSSKKS